MRLRYCSTLFFLMVSAVSAEPKIFGPSTHPEKLPFYVRGEDVPERRNWIITPTLSPDLEPLSGASDTDKSKIFLFFNGLPKGTYYIQLVTDDGKKLSGSVHEITIGKPGPNPDPDPDPDPEPTPDNLSDIAKKVRDLAKGVGSTDEIKQVAQNYGGINSAIAAGAYNSLSFVDARAKIVSDVFFLNKKVSEKNDKWNTFFESLRDIMTELDVDGKLDTVGKIKSVFVDIQTGLEAASK